MAEAQGEARGPENGGSDAGAASSSAASENKEEEIAMAAAGSGASNAGGGGEGGAAPDRRRSMIGTMVGGASATLRRRTSVVARQKRELSAAQDAAKKMQHMEASTWTIAPDKSKWVQNWDAALAVALVYTSVVTPAEVAFGAGRGCDIGQLQAAPLSVVVHSFRLIFRRAIISRSGLEA
jgi:hypothetical protein